MNFLPLRSLIRRASFICHCVATFDEHPLWFVKRASEQLKLIQFGAAAVAAIAGALSWLQVAKRNRVVVGPMRGQRQERTRELERRQVAL